jgi:excisionase family DNA binding protein
MSVRTQPRRRLASIPSAADYAACSTKTIRRRVADGSLPAVRFGPRVIRVDLDDVDALLRPVPSAQSSGTHATGFSAPAAKAG